MQEYAQLVAEYHVKLALEAACENALLIDQLEYIDCSIGYQEVKRIEKDSILNAYKV